MRRLGWVSAAILVAGLVISLYASFGLSETPTCGGHRMPVGTTCKDVDGSGDVVKERSYESVRNTAGMVRLVIGVTGIGLVVIGSVGVIIGVARRTAKQPVPHAAVPAPPAPSPQVTWHSGTSIGGTRLVPRDPG
jgi:hypothetical protein